MSLTARFCPKALCALGCAAAVLLVAAQARAGEDFDASSTDWNGLSALMSTASKIDVQLVAGSNLDWAQVSERDVLLIVGPRALLSEAIGKQLKAFLSAGGRLILADDFRSGPSWASDLGIEWVDQPVRAEPTMLGNPNLPLVRVDPSPEAEQVARSWRLPQARFTPAQFLAHNLTKPIVLNHPAAVRIAPGANAVLWGRFSGGDTGWLAEAERDSGRVLVLSDPSVLINQMLQRFYENRQFAANLLRYYCVVDRPCKVRLLTGSRLATGEFTPQKHESPVGWRAGLAALQQLLAELADLLRGSYVSPALLALVLALLGIPVLRRARLPLPELPPLPQTWRRSSAVAETVQAWLATPDADYRKPARLLATQLARWLDQVGEPAAPLQPAGQAASAQRKAAGRRRETGLVDDLVRGGRCSPQAGQRLREVLNNLQKATQDGGPAVTRRQFGQLAAEVEWAESLLRHTLQSAAPPATGHAGNDHQVAPSLHENSQQLRGIS